HYDPRVLLLHHLEAAIHRVLTLGSAPDHARDLGDVVSRDQSKHIGGKVRLQNEDNLIDRRTLLEAPKGVHKHRNATQLQHLLGAVRVHTRADAGGRDDSRIELRVGHCAAELCRGALGRPSSLKRPKIILPAVVCNTLVTDTSTFLPIIRRALSTTTIVPSSRYATPWLYSFPSFRTKTRMISPGSTTGFKALASSLMLRTDTPRSCATLFRLKSLVTILASICLASSMSL